MAKVKSPESEPKSKTKRTRVSQSDVPRHSLREALTVAQAITDNFASQPTLPHQVAMALGISPTSSGWRTLTGAAVAYGLTNGAYGSEKIGLQELGRRATSPTEEGDDLKARAEAALKPKVFAEFFSKYNRAKFPQDNIAKNVLQHDFSVPLDRGPRCSRNPKRQWCFCRIYTSDKDRLFCFHGRLKTFSSHTNTPGK